MSAYSAGDDSITRRSFLGGATTASAVALSGLKLSQAAADTPHFPGDPGDPGAALGRLVPQVAGGAAALQAADLDAEGR